MTAIKVEIHQGYWWTCDDCGRDNHGNAELDLPMEQVEALFEASEFEMPDVDDMQLIYVPDKVTCRHCGAKFETES